MDICYKNIDEQIQYGRTITKHPQPADFHLHNHFEIYFFISGNVNYFIEKKVYSLRFGDLLLMNSHEIHKPSFYPGEAYERVVIHFDPALAQTFSTPSFNLLNCFTNRPSGEQNLISLNIKQSEEILKLFDKMEALGVESSNGSDILKLAGFIELLVFINRVYSNTLPPELGSASIPEKLVPVLDYIDLNLESDLSLGCLERHFYINRFYLSRIFRQVTGSSLHEFIRYKRISKAKKLLSEGCNVTEACTKSGFNDYSNFLRMFKRTVGISPGQYKKSEK